MTAIRSTSPTRRETAVIVRGRPLVIEAHPAYCRLRRKGCREAYLIHWQTVWQRAAEMEAMLQQEERRKRREDKRKLRRGGR